jgi:hypothetical protein
MKKLMLSAALLLGTIGLVNAQHSQTGTQHDMGHMQMMQNCPMHVQGAKMVVADTTTGVAVEFTSEPGKVAELRRKLEFMATMRDANGNTKPMMRGQMISATERYEETADGGRIIFTPTDPSQLEELRKQVRAHTERMEKGECPMMQGMMGGIKKAEPAPKDDNHDSHHP